MTMMERWVFTIINGAQIKKNRTARLALQRQMQGRSRNCLQETAVRGPQQPKHSEASVRFLCIHNDSSTRICVKVQIDI